MTASGSTMYGERARRARQMALEDPTMTQSDIARAVGMTRQGVALALQGMDVSLPDGRLTARRGRRAGEARAASVSRARSRMASGERLTREERHLLQEDYRRRERAGLA